MEKNGVLGRRRGIMRREMEVISKFALAVQFLKRSIQDTRLLDEFPIAPEKNYHKLSIPLNNTGLSYSSGGEESKMSFI